MVPTTHRGMKSKPVVVIFFQRLRISKRKDPHLSCLKNKSRHHEKSHRPIFMEGAPSLEVWEAAGSHGRQAGRVWLRVL